MTRTALFIDLPNFYGSLLKSRIIEEPDILREYVLEWLDLDLLAKALTPSFLGIWVFYSQGKLGPAAARIDGNLLNNYIDRINDLEGVTACDVGIPGEQREALRYKCEECGHEADAQSKSEKGIDSSLIVHLYDTMDSWDVAYLLSGDADFVPAVASLRRRGRIVNGAGFPAVSSALVRECYRYIDLSEAFLKEDIAAYSIFRKGGLADQWLNERVTKEPSGVATDSIKLTVHVRPHGVGGRWHSEISLAAEGSIKLSPRKALVEEFRAKFPGQCSGENVFTVGEFTSIALNRRLDTFWPTLDQMGIARSHDHTSYYRRFSRVATSAKYSLADP